MLQNTFFSSLLLLSSILAQDAIEPEFASVTCGSIIKLANKQNGYRLHSHEVKYGTGSGQQSITGTSKGNDPNSYFSVTVLNLGDGKSSSTSSTPSFNGSREWECERGTPITCNSLVELTHVKTGKKLHSHPINSPLSNQQEVSAHDIPDHGDHWLLRCNTKTWPREKPISLEHISTKKLLSCNSRWAYGAPIQGQLEVSGKSGGAGDTELWIAQEGIYFSSDNY